MNNEGNDLKKNEFNKLMSKEITEIPSIPKFGSLYSCFICEGHIK